MLSSADEGIARRDTALPELRTLLDPEAFAEAMEPHVPGIEPESAARCVYLKYKPQTNCLAAYKVSAGGREVDVYAKIFGSDADVKIANALRRKEKAGSGRVVLEERAMAVSVFPNDDKLKQLTKLARDARKFMKGIVPDLPELWDAEISTLRYKPERRYVARVSVDGEPRAIIKLYRDDDFRTTRENAAAFGKSFKTSGPFRVGSLLGSSEKYHAVAFEWRDGVPLGDAISSSSQSERTDALETAGAALAELHSQPPDGLRKLTRKDEGDTLAALVEPLVFNMPESEELIRSLAGRLAARLAEEAPFERPTHGDFYEDQVIIGGGTATLLDFDEAFAGDPAVDLGLFIAHLEKDAMLGRLDRRAAASAAHSLLAGYRAFGAEANPEKVRMYTAVGLFRLAPHPFRAREPQWPSITAAILARAAEMSGASKSPSPASA